MELGILLGGSGLPVTSFEEGFGIAREIGYTWVELSGSDVSGAGGRPDLGSCGAAEARDLAQRALAMGLRISAIQSHQGFPLNDPQALERSVAHTLRMLGLARECGIPVVHVATGEQPDRMPPGSVWRGLQEVFDILLDHARGAGVRLAIEPVFTHVVGCLSALTRLLEVIDRPDLYINYDPSPFHYHDESAVPLISEFGDRIVHAHARDSYVAPDPGCRARGTAFEMPGKRAFHFAPPGKGHIDQLAVICALRETGFRGVLSVEVGPDAPQPERAARECFAFLKSLLQQTGDVQVEP